MSRRNRPTKSKDDHIDSDGPDLSDDDSSLSSLATGARRTKKQKTTMSNEDQRLKSMQGQDVGDLRLQIAREYLESVNISVDSDEESEVLVEHTDSEDDGYTNDIVARKLRQQTLKLQGKEKRYSVVDSMSFDHLPLSISAGDGGVPLLNQDPLWVNKKHRFYITATSLAQDNTFVISASHGGAINKHDIETGKVTKISAGPAEGHKGHKGPIWGASLSSDNVYLATAGQDRSIRIWDMRSNQQVHLFNKHQKPATCCKFLRNTLTLYSSGYDRDIHAYDCEKMAYMETFYGPTAPTIAMDCLYQNRVFLAGEDCTARILKPETESLVPFQTAKDQLLSLDCIAAFDHDTIITGSQTNHLQLWNSKKRKPMDTIINAHSGATLSHLGTRRFGEAVQTLSKPVENWIVSLTALYPTDLAFSGSNDGYIRAWQAHLDDNKLNPIFNIPVQGFVNCLEVANDGRFLIAAIGKNHRLGSWQGHITDNVVEGLYMYDLTSLSQGRHGRVDLTDLDEQDDSESD